MIDIYRMLIFFKKATLCAVRQFLASLPTLHNKNTEIILHVEWKPSLINLNNNPEY